ncbi:McrB family protein [Psychrobacter sp. I-STPA6b]|uniref:McrB family protein n=1 Tax=Psychrobacter sp. I-STPA6b TaxID=2585718 RepID=UPI001D0CC4D8|nr:AAA family ATPase [Psychrobacter sp. I-STPA6b]
MILNLSKYLDDISENQKFKAEINTRWGYIKFSNSGQRGGVKYFSIGIDAILQTLIDIKDNIEEFKGSEEYIEKEWRDLGSQFYTDSTANALATVQTKPLFCTLSKIISWANNINVENYSENEILLNTTKLERAINKLEELIEEYPEPNSYLKDRYINHELNTIYYGAPGTGKSHTIKEKLKSIPKENIETVTFYPDYDYTSFVGGYRPVSEDGEIKYEFVPQVFTNIYVKAWSKPDQQFYLVIEEINRGNCAEIFGDIFQLLDQNQEYTVTPSNELKAYLIKELSEGHQGIINGLKMPHNLTILATMNTSDQSLFPMDSAFKRRWDWEYIPINYERNDENISSSFKVNINDKESFYWIDFIKAVNDKIKINPNLGMDKCIGNYFIIPEEGVISLKSFINKAIFYLWNDVFKDEFSSESIFLESITYEDFFPIDTNGEARVREILDSLDIEIKMVMDSTTDEDID